jgi:hypothetical protein
MLIGTHDSAAYSIDFNVSFWEFGNQWEIIRLLALSSSLIASKVRDLSLTQNQTISQQLSSGASILDIRVSRAGNVFFTSHTFCCRALQDDLIHIRQFLQANSNRFVIIFIKPDFVNQGTILGHETPLLDLIAAQLLPVINNIQLFYTPLEISLSSYPFITNGNTVPNVYYDVSTVSAFTDNFNNTTFLSNSLFISVLTPPTDAFDALTVSIQNYAAELNPVAVQLLSDRYSQGEELPAMVIFDYFNVYIFETSESGLHSHTLSVNNGGSHAHTIQATDGGDDETSPASICLRYYIKIN